MPSISGAFGSEGRTAASTSSIRHSNLALVANEVFSVGGGLTRADIAVRTGLTRATVSRLVSELISLRILAEAELLDDGRPGRPGTPLYPASGTIVSVGTEVNVDRVAGCALDLTGSTVDSFAVTISPDEFTPALPLEILKRELAVMLTRLSEDEEQRVMSIHVAVPGVVNAASNTVAYAPNLCWDDVNLNTELNDVVAGIPLSADNDAKLQAVSAHAQLGTDMQRPGTFFYISGDIGIGGAILNSGEAMQGAHGWAGEIGHTTIDPRGPQCHCGARGCLEKYAGQREILSRAKLPLGTSPEQLKTLLEEENPDALEAVERAGWALGIAIANTVNLLDIEDAVLGTALAPIVPWLLPPITEQLNMRTLARSARDIGIHPAANIDFPASRGGALRGLSSLLQSPTMLIDSL
ncbi:ROK family transcriptional regulator [Actinomycetaceae bacterium WB03_NA08]|uniref:ROK family transcriptional regulator n=1 Tax=Scrofimicrobium canadense TaxID=2652290 RepID=A0A6N7W9A8_9ACTO|nr:ROK family transcriptional regulator [Scrofimicrobium canadense]MSS85053.1 ROK family transcriptional regulator [Scrofimicrobium canadense]